MCVNNLPRVNLTVGQLGFLTRDLLIASPAPYATPPTTLVHPKYLAKKTLAAFVFLVC